MEYLSKSLIKNKSVILRCDFNVPIENGIITDDNKIKESLKTIKYLLDNNNRVIILSHFGRVKSEDDFKNNSLYPVFLELQKYIDLDFVKDPLNLDEINLSNKRCFLVENTRFTDVPEKRESSNDLSLAAYWASFGDVFVLDAFGSLHRAHSSTAGIGKYLDTYVGFLVEKELANLSPLISNVNHPFVVIMGGAKADDKIKIIESLLQKCDKLILTGGILNTFLSVANINVYDSLKSEDESVRQSVKDIISKYQDRLVFTDSFLVKRGEEIVNVNSASLVDKDIIMDNIPNVLDTLKSAKTIFFNGSCGKYEDSNYAKGTYKLLNDLKTSGASIYAGGGDTISVIQKLGFKDAFTYLSSGGGATLEYIAFNNLKALEWINKNSVNNH